MNFLKQQQYLNIPAYKLASLIFPSPILSKTLTTTQQYFHQQKTYVITNYRFDTISIPINYYQIRDHLTIMNFRINSKNNESVSKIISKGLPLPVILQANTLRKFKKQQKAKSNPQLSIVQEILLSIKKSKNIELIILKDYSGYPEFYISYIKEMQCFCLHFEKQIFRFDVNNQTIYSNQKYIKRQLRQFYHVFVNLFNQLNAFEKMELRQILLIYTLHTYLIDDKDIQFIHVIRNDSDSYCQDVSKSNQLLKKYKFFKQNRQTKIIKIQSEDELIKKLLDIQMKVFKNKNQIQNKILKIIQQNIIMGEFILKNQQCLIYEKMNNCLKQNLIFSQETRNKFPCDYYLMIYDKMKILDAINIHYQLSFEQKIKIVKYSINMKFPLQKILQSSYIKSISQIQNNRFTDYQGKTIMVYLIIGPLGMKKTQILQALQSKVEARNCTSIILTKKKNSNLNSFDSDTLKNHFKRKDLFINDNLSFVFVDYAFHELLPEILEKNMNEWCPNDCHYKIFHILPFCQNKMIFYHQKLDRNIQFPFSSQLIIYCLRNIQARKDHEGLIGNSIQSLSKAIHYICSVFKNLNPYSYELHRHKIIQIEYKINIEDLNCVTLNNLQSLLELSYKKQYNKNDNLLYYFLEEIENLQVIISNAEQFFEEISQQILSKSFQRLPFFPVIDLDQ